MKTSFTWFYSVSVVKFITSPFVFTAFYEPIWRFQTYVQTSGRHWSGLSGIRAIVVKKKLFSNSALL